MPYIRAMIFFIIALVIFRKVKSTAKKVALIIVFVGLYGMLRSIIF